MYYIIIYIFTVTTDHRVIHSKLLKLYIKI